MKVVLFCGGLGTRLREQSESIPKPMVNIGYRPILWHVMKYYAHFGHKDFILCLGYKADYIKDYFLRYNECLSNDFVLSEGATSITLLNRDIQDWKITFVDTGTASNVGQRLKAVQGHLAGEEEFLVNYSDGLTDLHLPALIDDFHRHQKIASFLCVRPTLSFHVVAIKDDGVVQGIRHMREAGIWLNGGYFVFKRNIFEYINEGEDLVQEPFQRLIDQGQLVSYAYDGFWACMDTFKDKESLNEMYSRGKAPWEVWKNESLAAAARPSLVMSQP